MSRYDFDHEQPYIVIEKHEAGIAPLLIGLAIGAGAALLFAPRSGAETRQDIKRRASRVRRAAEDAAGDVADTVAGRVADTFQDARRRVEDRIDAVRQSVDLKRQQVNRAVHAGRVAADEARAELEARIAERKAAHAAGAHGPRSRQPATADRSDEG
ncbi:MAG TPA: YtxH domain-containing protein [Gemmatimonadaceae bacterium]|nr:YtxH domain-containing protein [Gemmatimonadaceae bacterium]